MGVGGGSVIDCCKAAAMAAVYDGDLWNDYYSSVGIVYFEPLPLGVIVTVGGSGAEMNGGAVITNEKLKIKTGRDYPRCNPRFALMDPSYTFSVRNCKRLRAATIRSAISWRFTSADRTKITFLIIFQRRL